jgi:predicted alpha/beta hydrolase
MSTSKPAVVIESIRLVAREGHPLAALRYSAPGAVRGHVVVAGANAVAQRFYRPFAEFAAARGYPTLMLDYRGIGLSRPESLRDFRMAYRDWAELDLAAAVAAMAADTVPPYVVGHSFGGHAFDVVDWFGSIGRGSV